MTNTIWKAYCELIESERYLHQMCMAVDLTIDEITRLTHEVEKAQAKLNEMR